MMMMIMIMMMKIYNLLCFVLVLQRLQNFLPQMAEANEKLKQQMAEAPAGSFDIESIDEAKRVIEMVSMGPLVNVNFPTHLC